MNINDEINQLEDTITAILLRYPDLIKTEEVDLKLFKKRHDVILSITQTITKGQEIDVFMVAEEGKTTIQDLAHLIRNSLGSRSNYRGYIDMLRTRKAAQAVSEKIADGYERINSGEPVNEVIADVFTESLQSMSMFSEKKNVYRIGESTESAIAELDRMAGLKEDCTVGLGIDAIDEKLGPIYPGNLCVIGGRPGTGKTSMAIHSILQNAKDGKKVGFFSTEMDHHEVSFRIFSHESGVDSKKIRTPKNLSDSDFSLLSEVSDKLKRLSVFISDKAEMTNTEITMQCQVWLMADGLDMIVIDYLTRLKSDRHYQKRNEEVAYIVTQLKHTAKTLKIPIILLAQLNRGVEARGNRKPMASDLRDSGVIEQEADQIVLISDENDSVIIGKNRHGISHEEVTVTFDRKFGIWH